MTQQVGKLHWELNQGLLQLGLPVLTAIFRGKHAGDMALSNQILLDSPYADAKVELLKLFREGGGKKRKVLDHQRRRMGHAGAANEKSGETELAKQILLDSPYVNTPFERAVEAFQGGRGEEQENSQSGNNQRRAMGRADGGEELATRRFRRGYSALIQTPTQKKSSRKFSGIQGEEQEYAQQTAFDGSCWCSIYIHTERTTDTDTQMQTQDTQRTTDTDTQMHTHERGLTVFTLIAANTLEFGHRTMRTPCEHGHPGKPGLESHVLIEVQCPWLQCFGTSPRTKSHDTADGPREMLY